MVWLFKHSLQPWDCTLKMMFHAFHDMCYTSKYESFIKIVWLRTSMHESKAPVQVQWDSLLKIELCVWLQESLTPINDDLYSFYGISIQDIFCIFEAFQEVRYWESRVVWCNNYILLLPLVVAWLLDAGVPLSDKEQFFLHNLFLSGIQLCQ